MVRRRMNSRDYYLSMASRPLPPNKFSRYRGVQKSSDARKPYRAAFRYRGLVYNLGNFENEIDAARAYNKGALAVIGDFAILNDLPDERDPSENQQADL
jgi:hypothetical protein